jgi:hypothetical protein
MCVAKGCVLLYENALFYWWLLLQQHITMGMLLCCSYANIAHDFQLLLWLKDQLKASGFLHLLEVQVTSKIAL